MDFEMFKQGIDVKEFNEQLLQHVLYRSAVSSVEDKVVITLDE